jgi:hypothetical protein
MALSMPNQKPTDSNLTTRVRPTDAELDQESIVTPADIAAAVASFNQYVPATAKGMLDAKEEKK